MSTSACFDHLAVPERRTFTGALWLSWIAAGVNALPSGWYVTAPENYIDDAFGNILILLLLRALVVPIAATVQWLVLRRSLPDLLWGIWLLASGMAAATKLLVFLVAASSAARSPLGWATVLIGTSTAEAVVLAFGLGWGAGRWPTEFIVCSALAAAVTFPLDAEVLDGIHALPTWLRLYRFDPLMQLVAVETPLRLTAGVVTAAITGYGLRRLCQPRNA
jgi:hypothetical protein